MATHRQSLWSRHSHTNAPGFYQHYIHINQFITLFPLSLYIIICHISNLLALLKQEMIENVIFRLYYKTIFSRKITVSIISCFLTRVLSLQDVFLRNMLYFVFYQIVVRSRFMDCAYILTKAILNSRFRCITIYCMFKCLLYHFSCFCRFRCQ